MGAEHQYRIAALSACLSLVRPVGMTEGETIDWLEVAADTLSHLPVDLVERGARAARTTCTHHGQIVPAIIAETKQAMEWRSTPKPRALRLVAPVPKVEGPLPDPATLSQPLKQIGLSAGWIAEREDGRVEWTEEGAA